MEKGIYCGMLKYRKEDVYTKYAIVFSTSVYPFPILSHTGPDLMGGESPRAIGDAEIWILSKYLSFFYVWNIQKSPRKV